MIVLDASVLIGYLDSSDAQHERSTRLLLAHDDVLGAHPLTLAEVLVGPARQGGTDAVLKVLEEIGVETLTFRADSAVQLAGLQAGSGLRMPDCCVLLAALDSRGRLATWDDRLAGVARGLGLTVLGEEASSAG